MPIIVPIITPVIVPPTPPSAAGSTSTIYDALNGIVDFAHSEIHLSVWFPSAAQNAGASLSMYLLSQDGDIVPLAVPVIGSDHWHDLVLFPPSDLQSGHYQFGITYVGNVSATFWVDAISIFERAVTWSARANQGDNWTDFQDVINSDTSGVTFANRGTQLQLRAQSHQQAGSIFSAPQIIPVYAELGRSVYPEDIVVDPFPTSSAIEIYPRGSTEHPATLTFTAGSIAGFLAVELQPGNTYNSLPIQTTSLFPSTFPVTFSLSSTFTSVTHIAGVYYDPSVYEIVTAIGPPVSGSIPINPITPTTYFLDAAFALTAPPWEIISYQWSFGDGLSANGNPGYSGATTHTYIEAGNFTVTLTVIDIYGGRSIATANVTIT